jgi:GMP synthase (glutamine-hydrolysing)
MHHQTIAVIDYGSQYSQLICRRVREANVYAELVRGIAPLRCCPPQPQGIILSGGPNSVYDAGAPTLPDAVLTSGVPVLGICYGLQLLAHTLGGRVTPSARTRIRRGGHPGHRQHVGAAASFSPTCPPR